MSNLVDIVNFNADASCLDSAQWLSILNGGPQSLFCKWLSLYTRYKKPMVLGMTGATVSDLNAHNPEAIKIVKNNPDIFQIILRPYAHDIPLLRTPDGFFLNLSLGKAVIHNAFDRIDEYYLSPEFMLMSNQITALARTGIKATFINSTRYCSDIALRIPNHPYYVRGIQESKLGCIPVHGELSQLYLQAIQLWDNESWNKIMQNNRNTLFLWRDGESSFLIPDGIEREKFWITHCHVERCYLGDERYETPSDPHSYHSYPPHSFSAWMKELRMLGYLGRVQEIEKKLKDVPALARYLWLLTINSDILSSVEKNSPHIQLRGPNIEDELQEYKIFRTERGYEGEEYLALLEQYIINEKYPAELYNPTAPHLIKAKYRIEHLKKLEPLWNNEMHCL